MNIAVDFGIVDLNDVGEIAKALRYKGAYIQTRMPSALFYAAADKLEELDRAVRLHADRDEPAAPVRASRENHRMLCPRCGADVIQLRKGCKAVDISFCQACGKKLCWTRIEY